jgi:hypothetical protein
MAIDPYTAYLLYQGGKKAIGSVSRLFKPKFGQTRYGSLLHKIKEQGIYSQATRSNILTKTGRQFDITAAPSIQKTQGRLIRNNMYNSVASVKTLAQPGIAKARVMAQTEGDLQAVNEETKQRAIISYAQGIDRDKAERRGAVADLGGVALDFGAQYYGKKAADKKELYAATTAKEIAEDEFSNTLKLLVKKSGYEAYKFALKIMSESGGASNIPPELLTELLSIFKKYEEQQDR